MQSTLAPSGPSMTSAIAIHEDHVGQLAEVDAKLSRTFDASRIQPPRRSAKEATAGAAAPPAVDPLSDPAGCRRHGVLSR